MNHYLIQFAFIVLTFTLLYLFFYLYDFQNIKTRHPDLFGAVLGKGHL